jgi:hypothetical protein
MSHNTLNDIETCGMLNKSSNNLNLSNLNVNTFAEIKSCLNNGDSATCYESSELNKIYIY